MVNASFPDHLIGLSDEEVIAARQKHGPNTPYQHTKNTWWKILVNIGKEPMFILLVLISIIYFLSGQFPEGYFMLGAIGIVSAISFYQDNRSRITLDALESLNAPFAKVIRNNSLQQISAIEIVPGDLALAEEGDLLNADGVIVFSHDFSVNESTLTGEAFAVSKSEHGETNLVYSGTMVASGMAVYRIEKTGLETKIGQLGHSLTTIKDEPSPLQLQIEKFVRKMIVIGAFIFLLVWIVSYLKSLDWLASLLKGLTLAMSILPEEIPVAFAAFMALGSRRLMREGILVKRTRVVETLGSATVICTDKTGTITENKMSLQAIYSVKDHQLVEKFDHLNESLSAVLEAAMWASESNPFDPMEKALHEVYQACTTKDKRSAYHMIHEYPLGGIPPMMTHVFADDQQDIIVAAKGAPEAILKVSDLSPEEKKQVHQVMDAQAQKGYRMLGVALAPPITTPFPALQQDIHFHFLGLVFFYDPPKKNIKAVIRQFEQAGVQVKMMTGDNAITTKAIADGAGFPDTAEVVDGEVLMNMEPAQMLEKIKRTSIFTRMFPEAKLEVIRALRDDHQVVAMIGDGVNDGPALKAANIGIAMGQKGTEIAKQAANLILLRDDLSGMVTSIAAGRRIYANLKRAIQYIVSIHIPIILTVSLPLLFGWTYPVIFTPLHVIFLELVMGPTCSIAYENEPMEKNSMMLPPRPVHEHFLNWKEMSLSILQGLVITAGVLLIYQFSIHQGDSEQMTRTMVFTTLVISNILLTLVNRSFYDSIFEVLRKKNKVVMAIIFISIGLLAAMLYLPPLNSFFYLTRISIADLGICGMTAVVSVLWIEVWKWQRRRKTAAQLEPVTSI